MGPTFTEREKTVFTILYIEDNETNRQLVRMIVTRRTDLTLLEAETGKSGLQTAFTQQPDLILLDISLPDISGPEVLRKLLDNPLTQHTPVIALTGNSLAETRMTSPDFSDYLSKPIDIQVLYSAIDRALNIE